MAFKRLSYCGQIVTTSTVSGAPSTIPNNEGATHFVLGINGAIKEVYHLSKDINGNVVWVGGYIVNDTYKTTSTTCNNIVSTGSLTFTVSTGLSYTPLQDIIIYADANNHMHGEVVSYNTNTGILVVDIHQKTGSGSFCNWVLNLDAIKLAEVSVYFGLQDPITAGLAGVEGDLYYKTTTGTNAGVIKETWVYDGTAWIKVDTAAYPLDVLNTVQSTPTSTGNTTNLNSTFKDANGDTWIVDANGDAIKAGSSDIKYSKLLFVDPVNGSDTNGNGSDNNMYKTIAKALTVANSSGYRIVLAEHILKVLQFH